MRMKGSCRILVMLLVGLAAASPAAARAQPASAMAAMRDEVRMLRDREEIRQLLIDYGRTIDARDFAAFGRLFAKDGEYVSGAGTPARGPEKIASGLAAIFATNPSGIQGPNYHLFFNETIEVRGDRATGRSMALFVGIGQDGNPQALMLAGYDDVYVREAGRWRFQRRAVQGRIPAPAAPR